MCNYIPFFIFVVFLDKHLSNERIRFVAWHTQLLLTTCKSIENEVDCSCLHCLPCSMAERRNDFENFSRLRVNFNENNSHGHVNQSTRTCTTTSASQWGNMVCQFNNTILARRRSNLKSGIFICSFFTIAMLRAMRRTNEKLRGAIQFGPPGRVREGEAISQVRYNGVYCQQGGHSHWHNHHDIIEFHAAPIDGANRFCFGRRRWSNEFLEIIRQHAYSIQFATNWP